MLVDADFKEFFLAVVTGIEELQQEGAGRVQLEHAGEAPVRGTYGYGYGGGCLGGLISAMIAPIVIMLVAAVFLFASVTNAFTAISEGGIIQYDEYKLQTYGMERYAEIFDESEGYEDNILLVFVVYEDHYDYNYIAILG